MTAPILSHSSIRTKFKILLIPKLVATQKKRMSELHELSCHIQKQWNVEVSEDTMADLLENDSDEEEEVGPNNRSLLGKVQQKLLDADIRYCADIIIFVFTPVITRSVLL